MENLRSIFANQQFSSKKGFSVEETWLVYWDYYVVGSKPGLALTRVFFSEAPILPAHCVINA